MLSIAIDTLTHMPARKLHQHSRTRSLASKHHCRKNSTTRTLDVGLDERGKVHLVCCGRLVELVARRRGLELVDGRIGAQSTHTHKEGDTCQGEKHIPTYTIEPRGFVCGWEANDLCCNHEWQCIAGAHDDGKPGPLCTQYLVGDPRHARIKHLDVRLAGGADRGRVPRGCGGDNEIIYIENI